MNTEKINFIQQSSPDGALKHSLQGKDFLQSEEWRKFQESAGRRTFNISGEDFSASIIEHSLPIVGKYFYIPRGPITWNIEHGTWNKKIAELIHLAKKEKIGWIRIEPANEGIFEIIKNSAGNAYTHSEKRNAYMRSLPIKKAPHDMQPKQILVLDITKSEEELLAEMKSKTRYNIKLAEKRGVKIHLISNLPNKIQNFKEENCHPEFISGPQEMLKQVQHDSDYYVNEFIRLVKITAERDKIISHPESYYRKMFEVIPGDILKLYAAEYDGKIIAANLMVFYGDTATYLHGASDNEHRNLMAPYLLQWQAIKDAKAAGCEKYDLGGVATENSKFQIPNSKQISNSKSQMTNNIQNSKFKIQNSFSNWAGITRFKTGFFPNTQPIEFLGCYDIVVSSYRYFIYKLLQAIKSFSR